MRKLTQCLEPHRPWGRVAGAATLVAIAAVAVAASRGTSNPADPPSQQPDGHAVYARCQTCHQATGLGMPNTFPPLAGSEWLLHGDGSKAARIVLHGMQGPIRVAGKSFQGVMPAYGTGQPMSDAEVAAVLTYARGAWGNRAPAVPPAVVARERRATAARQTPWSAAELGAPR